jgi:PASTA domain
MAQTYRIPFRGSATLGRGFNVLTGEIVGKALNVVSREQAVSGGEAEYEYQLVETHESLMKSLGLSVEASGRYGLFSAEGKFAMSEKSNFNASSTFVVASCRVQNAFEMVDRVELLPEARPLLENPAKFKDAYGTSFVRGLQTGGEFYIVLQVTSTNQDTQNSLSASFKADCQGLVASGSFQMSYNQAMSSSSSKTQVSVLMYQRAGRDEQLSYVADPPSVIQRLKDFPRIAREHPCGYEVEVANYNTLALPEVNEEEVADREMALTDCARLRLKYMTRRNDIEFARENRIFFEDLPADAQLSDLWERYSRAMGLVQVHAQKIAARRIEPTIFDLSAANPPLDLPVINFRRVNVPSDIPVPPLVGNAVDNAKAQLQAVGLEYDGNGQAVQANSGSVLNTVTAQEPAAGTRVPPQTRVRLTYSYVPDERFTWVRPYVNYRDVVRLQRAGGG